MRPVEMRLHNICQHRELTFRFETGITGVIGRNGQGKSNLVDTALFFAITGKTPEGFNKEDLLSWNTTEGHTEFDFEDHGVFYTLHRAVHSPTVRLDSADKKEKFRNADANAQIVTMLGRPFDTFYEACWTPQGGLIAVLSMTHSQRMGFFQKLADTQRAEQIRGIIQDAGLNKLPDYPDRQADINAKIQELIGIQTQAEALQVGLGKYRELLAEYEKRLDAVRALLRLPTEAQYSLQVQIAEAELQRRQTAYEQQAAASNLNEVPEASMPTLAEDQRYNWSQQRITQLALFPPEEQKLTDLEKEKPVAAPEPEPDLLTALGEMRRQLTELTPGWQMAKTRKCPTCLRDYVFAGGDAEIQQILNTYAALDTQTRELAKALERQTKANSDYRCALSVWISKQDRQLDRIDHLRQSLAELDRQLAGFDPEDYLRRKTAATAFMDYNRRVIERNKTLEALKLHIERAGLQLEQTRKAPHVSAEERKNAEEFMSNYQQLVGNIAGLEKTRAELSGRKQTLDAVLLSLQSEQKVRESTAQLRIKFDRARELLHRDYLPKVVMQTMLVGLNGLLDAYLGLFDVEFTAYIDEDFDFRCNFPEKSGVRVKALSGGQKVALAIAFRFALSDLLSASTPLIVMDEPTVWLDESNVQRILQVLQRVRVMADKGVYVLIATHEPSLAAAFTRVFEIG